MDSLTLAAGLVLVLITLYDVFQSVIVPRWTSRTLRISPSVIFYSWRAWRLVGLRIKNVTRREAFFGVYAPLALLVMLAAWALMLLFGYGLILYALRAEIHPVITDFGSALYLAGTSILTIGYGDLVARGTTARVADLLAGATGLMVIAVVISLIFSLHAAFQARESPVLALDGRAGAPPSGVTLLETFARLEMLDTLPQFFRDWEAWCGDIIQSHRAYPVLRFFRSHHENESWVAALGAVLDAAALLTSTVDGGPFGSAEMMYRLGVHAVMGVDYRVSFENCREPMVTLDEYLAARDRLADAGFPLREVEQSWYEFSRLRAQYAPQLQYLADFFAVPYQRWLGDRTHLSHAYGGIDSTSSELTLPAQRCPHVAEARDVSPHTDGCEECLRLGWRWVHLRMCRICGHVGCCDSSRGKHATGHFHDTGHPVMQSVEAGESWGWCYVDEVMVDLDGAPKTT